MYSGLPQDFQARTSLFPAMKPSPAHECRLGKRHHGNSQVMSCCPLTQSLSQPMLIPNASRYTLTGLWTPRKNSIQNTSLALASYNGSLVQPLWQLLQTAPDQFSIWANPYARFTLAGPMPRLYPDAVGGESGSTHPMHARPRPVSHRDTIHIGRCARALSADLDQLL